MEGTNLIVALEDILILEASSGLRNFETCQCFAVFCHPLTLTR